LRPHYTRTPQQNARTIWGPYFPGFTEHEQRLHGEAAFRDAVRRTGGLKVAAAQTFRHLRLSTVGRLRAQAEGRHYSTFSLYTPISCARPSRRSWPSCPGPRSAGLTSTSWSSAPTCSTGQTTGHSHCVKFWMRYRLGYEAITSASASSGGHSHCEAWGSPPLRAAPTPAASEYHHPAADAGNLAAPGRTASLRIAGVVLCVTIHPGRPGE